jgi:nascent polypeptide-associated complex subunit alpha
MGDDTDTTVDTNAQSGDASGSDAGQGKATRKISRGEKKLREALLKHNLQPVENVSSAMLLKPPQIQWTFSNPEVYSLENVFVLFGEPSGPNAGEQAVQDLKTAAPAEEAPPQAAPKIVEDTQESDATGLKEDDINTVMGQASVSRARAIDALREANGDLVTAVMNLTL